MVRKIMRTAAALCCCLAFTVSAAETAETRQDFKEAAEALERLFGQDFQVRFSSGELADFISEKVQGLSQQLGMPVKIDIRDFLVRFDERTKEFRSQLRLKNSGDFVGMALQKQANVLLKSNDGRLGKLISDLSLGNLQKFSAFLKENGRNMKFLGEKDGLSAYRFQPEKLVIGGVPVRHLDILIDPKAKTVSELKAGFNEKSEAALKLIYSRQRFRGRDIMVPDKVQIEHDLPAVGGFALPPKAEMDFGRFRLGK